MSLLEGLFWTSAVVVVYIYVGYPIVALLLARVVGRGVKRAPDCPRVTVLIAARNEAHCIRETVINKLDQDYPADLLDIIVVSDASDDGTDAIVEGLGKRVRLLRQESRGGKTAALNRAVLEARGQILVFADANSMYAPTTIRSLVANFADPAVGYVTGKMVYMTQQGSMVGDGCSTYMRYENWLRRVETRLGTVIGVDGGVDAVRKSLYVPMRVDQLPDFVLPLQVASMGFRVVYDPEALLKEMALAEHRDELQMRVRVSLRALWALWDMRRLLNPIKNGLLGWQLVSHKALRYLAFVPLAVLFVTSVVLAPSGTAFALAAAAQIAFYALGLIGWNSRRGLLVVALPYYFLLLNVSSALALVRFLRGQRMTVWAPRVG